MMNTLCWVTLILATTTLIEINASQFRELDRKNAHHNPKIFQWTALDHHYKKCPAICLILKKEYKNQWKC